MVACSAPALARIGTIDNVPAATLLLPYFEVDLKSPQGISTLFSLNNAFADAALAHVTLWTDEGIPTVAFDIYLTGFDTQTLNLRDVFSGVLPRTADHDADALDRISPRGALSRDAGFEGEVGPCGTEGVLYAAAPTPALTGLVTAHVRAAHTGKPSPIEGGCMAASYGDDVARGYVTVDVVRRCSAAFPSDPGYFGPGKVAIAAAHNALWGDYMFVDPAKNQAYGDALVHIEACGQTLGQPGCPIQPGSPTFYRGYVGGQALDGREPLPSQFALRFVQNRAGGFSTETIVWRELNQAIGPRTHTCGVPRPWFPLQNSDVVIFDEAENYEDHCWAGFAGIHIPNVPNCFGLATQKTPVAREKTLPAFLVSPDPSAQNGWMFLNLEGWRDNDVRVDVRQAWVSMILKTPGKYAVNLRAVHIPNAGVLLP